jgi:1,4-alpha-glucan branching enzyme
MMTTAVHQGMGAVPYPGGVTFRVWAPFASAVCVAGSFNGWSLTANPLTPEARGFWSTDVAAVRVNAQYKFVITNPAIARPFWKNTTRGLRGHEVNVHHVNDRDKVVAFHRWDRGGPRDDVVVLLNFANRSYDAYRIGLPRGGRWRVRLNSDWRGYSSVFTDHPSFDLTAFVGDHADPMPFGGDVGLGPYTALILSQDD